jgi:hypothetical protein
MTATAAIIRPLWPRPAWPTPTAPAYLKDLTRSYRRLRSPCRVAGEARVEDGTLSIGEVRATASRISFARWGAADEPSLRLIFYSLTSPPTEELTTILGEIGQHAIGRRYQRAWPNDDDAVLADMHALVGAYRDAIGNREEEFSVPTPSGGCWRAQHADLGVAGALALRTFVI